MGCEADIVCGHTVSQSDDHPLHGGGQGVGRGPGAELPQAGQEIE